MEKGFVYDGEYMMSIVDSFKKFSFFFRIHLFGYTITLVLVGIGVMEPDLSIQELMGWVIIAILYHVFAYVSNDLSDLEIDRTAKARQQAPLVSGTASISKTWLLVIFAVGGALGLAGLLGHPIYAPGILAVSITAMALYNWKGKRSRFPPLYDFLQGLAWGCLLLLGVGSGTADAFSLLFWLCLYQIVFIMLINGFHASLRDIKNDRLHGACTTAVLLGAEVDAGDCLIISNPLKRYVIALNVLLLGLMIGSTLVFVKTHPDVPLTLSGLIMGGLILLCAVLAQYAWNMLNSGLHVMSSEFFKLYLIGSSHMSVLLLIPFVFVYSLLPLNLRISMVFLFASSLILGNIAGAGYQSYRHLIRDMIL